MPHAKVKPQKKPTVKSIYDPMGWRACSSEDRSSSKRTAFPCLCHAVSMAKHFLPCCLKTFDPNVRPHAHVMRWYISR